MRRQFLAIAVLLLGSGAAAAADCEKPGFVTPDRYALPSPTSAIAAVDVNGDGLTDIVTLAHDDSNVITVLLGKADGTFEAALSSGGAEAAAWMVVGDFNNDGKPDVVTASIFSATRMHLGNGNGTFQDGVDLTAEVPVGILTAADVDGNGNLDLVYFDNVAGAVKILLGNGDGTFASPLELDDTANAIAFGKLDGNDTLDMVLTGGQGGGVKIYPGNGDGTFGDPLVLNAGATLTSARVIDVNKDGLNDVVVLSDFFLEVFPGHGDGSFGDPINSGAGNVPWSIAPADFDGDGNLDFVVSGWDPTGGNFGYPYLLILTGHGDGTFTTGAGYAVGGGPVPLVAADFGSDGHPDVALAPPADAAVWRLRGNGDGTLHGVLLFVGGELSTTALAAGDFDEDGRTDVAVLDNLAGASLIFVDILDAGPTLRVSHEYFLAGLTRTVTAADVDGDGHLDLVTVRSDTGAVLVLHGNGDGTFADPVSSAGPSTLVSAVAAHDFNGDGFQDLAVAWQNDAHTVGGLTIMLGDATAHVTPVATLPLFIPPAALLATDFDADGHADLAVVGGAPGVDGQLLILHGAGDGTFTAAGAYDTHAQPTAVVADDFVEDGVLDLAVGGDHLTVFRGFGIDNFFQVSQMEAPANLLVAADFDGDGHVDLASGSALMSGAGDGTFTLAQTFVTGILPSSIVSAEFNGDGLPDAAVGQYFGGDYAFLIPARGAHVVPPAAPATYTESTSLTVQGIGVSSSATYRWRLNGDPLSDGGALSGTTTPTLTIDPASFANAGSYDVVITDACGSIASNAVVVGVDFADVPPTSPFHDSVVAIATAGITAGCGGANYCPTNPVRRDQMAVFLLRAEHGPAYEPPTCQGTFGDVPCPGPFADWVEQLATERITAGCGPGMYCPASSVSRAQMAIFLVKTWLGPDFTPFPYAGIFEDVPEGSLGAEYIEFAYDTGITTGCSLSPKLYCPNASVSRQQMAVLLTRTFGF